MMLLTFAVWILLIFIGVHIGYSLMLASLFFFIISGQTSLFFFACKEMLGSINNFTLLAVPFFVLAGNIMNGGGVTVFSALHARWSGTAKVDLRT